MVDNKEAVVDGTVLSVPITIRSITTEVSCLVVHAIPFDLVVGRLSMKKMRASLDFDKDVATFRHNTGVTRVPLLTEGMQASSSLSEEFTSNDEKDEIEHETDEEDSENNSSHDLVLILSEPDSQWLGKKEEVSITSMLGHLNVKNAASSWDALYKEGFIVAWQLKDLSPSNVPYKHPYELNDYNQMPFPVRRMPPKHNKVVKKEIENMLKARVIKPAYSPWSFRCW